MSVVNFVTSLAIGVIVFLPHMAYAKKNRCSNIPSETPILVACVDDQKISFQSQHIEETFDKDEYFASLNTLMKNWLLENGIYLAPFCGRNVALYLSVPESNPSGYALRLVLKLDKGGVMFDLGGNPDSWTSEQTKLRVFAQGEKYPNSYGFTAGKLLAVANNGINFQKLRDFIAQYDGFMIKTSNNNELAIRVGFLDEVRTKQRLYENPHFDYFFKYVSLEHVYEWISYKKHVTTFEFVCELKN